MNRPSGAVGGRFATFVAVGAVVALLTSGHISLAVAGSGQDLIKASGVRGGLIVHLGCGDGRLTAALCASDSYLVQGVETDAGDVAGAREHIWSLGLYGKVSVRAFDGKRLPYVDNLVNLVVADELDGVPMEEVTRVLAPRGVALIDGKKIVKPWPKEIDEWTHYLHDASGNAVSQDTRVGPPRHLQWTADPRWARSHEHAASVAAMVSGDGKIFYLHDDGITGIIVRDLPERWALYARDAFSGVLLWKKEFTDFGSSAWDGVFHCREPMEIPRRLVFGGGKVYATLGFRNAAISVIDPDTGESLASFQEGRNNDELVWHDGVLLVRQRKSLPDYPLKGGSSGAVLAKSRQDSQPDIPAASMGDETIVALDSDTGEILWSREESRVVTMSLAALGESVCYHNFEQLVCLDLRSGEELWRAECPTWPDVTGVGGTLLMYDDKVVHVGSRGIQVFSLDDGKRLWQGPGLSRMSVRHPADLFAIAGRLWTGPTPEIAGARHYANANKTPSAAALLTGTSVPGFDIETGEVSQKLDLGKLVTPGHHTRCYRSKATSRFLIWPKRGMEFVSVTGQDDHERIDWARGECGYGVMPSGGLVYVPPHPCVCYLGVALDGFNALAPEDESKTKQPDLTAEQRLQRGPAYGGVQVSRVLDEDAWPMFRHDAQRSGRTPCEVPTDLSRKWAVDIGGKLTQPVVAGGSVYVASINTHTIHALHADSGQPRWRFAADARIDSPPTIHGGLVLFGCTDGKVYCLRAGDGELAWRFHAAPVDAHCVVRSQVESRWPVHGAVLVQQGVAYFSAGRSSFLDRGIYLYGLDPATGELLHQSHLDGPWPDSCKDSSACYAMEGAKTDVLTGDGQRIFLGFNEFDSQLKPLPNQPFTGKGSRQVHLRLMSTTGLLDGSWWDRGRWTYGCSWPGRTYTSRDAYTGQILSFDETTVYALNAFPSKNRMSPQFIPETKGYLLTAFRNDPETIRAATDTSEWKSKGIGKLSAAARRWERFVPIRSRGMVLAKDTLFLAGVPDVVPEDAPYAALDGRRGALLWAVSAADGATRSEMKLEHPPVFDGLIAANGKVYLSLTNGEITCFE